MDNILNANKVGSKWTGSEKKALIVAPLSIATALVLFVVMLSIVSGDSVPIFMYVALFSVVAGAVFLMMLMNMAVGRMEIETNDYIVLAEYFEQDPELKTMSDVGGSVSKSEYSAIRALKKEREFKKAKNSVTED